MSELHVKWAADNLLRMTYREMLDLERFIRDELRICEAACPREHIIANALDQWARRKLLTKPKAVPKPAHQAEGGPR
jgi:hypothetical protein